MPLELISKKEGRLVKGKVKSQADQKKGQVDQKKETDKLDKKTISKFKRILPRTQAVALAALSRARGFSGGDPQGPRLRAAPGNGGLKFSGAGVAGPGGTERGLLPASHR